MQAHAFQDNVSFAVVSFVYMVVSWPCRILSSIRMAPAMLHGIIPWLHSIIVALVSAGISQGS